MKFDMLKSIQNSSAMRNHSSLQRTERVRLTGKNVARFFERPYCPGSFSFPLEVTEKILIILSDHYIITSCSLMKEKQMVHH
jgi:hypothetical protein